jgi:hypothetical protein
MTVAALHYRILKGRCRCAMGEGKQKRGLTVRFPRPSISRKDSARASRWRRRPGSTKDQVTEIRRRAKAGEQKTSLAAEFGVSRQTLYSALA